MSSEGYITLPPDGSGKKVRALVKTVEGETVYMEVGALVDEDGNLISASNPLGISIIDTNRISKPVLGYNPNVGTTLEDVTELGVNVTPVPSSAIAMEIVSDSTDDDGDPVGIGARTLQVYGLDANWDIQNEIITLDGNTPVAVPGTWIRINTMQVMTVGANGVSVGTIKLTAVVGGTEYIRIEAGGNVALQCHYTVPEGFTAWISCWHVGLISTKKDTTARAILRATVEYSDRSLVPGVFHFQDIAMGQTGTYPITFKTPLECPARCDIKVSVQLMMGTGIVEASASIQIYLIPNV